MRSESPPFPRHSTLDQFFTDQKFEAYRALGYHAGGAAVAAMEAVNSAAAPPTAPGPPMAGAFVRQAGDFSR